MAFKVADAFIEVTAHTGRVETEVGKAVRDLPGKVGGDADRAGTGIGARIVAGLSVGLSRGSSQGNLFASVLGVMASKAAIFTAAGLAAVPVITQLSGVLGVLPALGFAGGAGLAALIIGTQGFFSALKDMSDPKAFAESLKQLSPNAREAAVAVASLRAPFTQLRRQIQDQLFAGFGQDIKNLGSAYLPVLNTGLGGAASSINAMVREWVGFATAPATIASTNVMFANTKMFLDALVTAVRPFVQALTQIGVVGSQFLPVFGQWLANLAQRFAEFITRARETGQLQAWMQGGITAVQQLWQVITNLWTAISNLTALLGPVLLPALIAVSGALATVTGFIRDNVGWLGPLAAGILAVVAGVKAWAIAQGVLNAVMALNPWLVVAAAVVAAAIFIITHWTQVKNFLAGVWNWVQSTASSVWNAVKTFITGAVSAAVSFVVGKWNEARATTAAVWNAITSAVSSAVSNVRNVVTSVINAVAGFLTGAWNNVRNTAVSAWNAIVSAVSSAINNVRSAVTSGANAAVSALSNAWNTARNTAVSAWNGMVAAVRGAVSNLMGVVRAIPGQIAGALGNLGSLLYNAGRSIIQGLVNGIRSMIGAVSSAVGSVMSAARNLLPFSPAKEGPFSGKGWTLYSGRSLVDALAAGVRDRGGALRSALSSVVGAASGQLNTSLPAAAARPSGQSTTGGDTGLRDVLDRLSRTAGVTVHVTQTSGSPAETGRFVALALRMG